MLSSVLSGFDLVLPMSVMGGREEMFSLLSKRYTLPASFERFIEDQAFSGSYDLAPYPPPPPPISKFDRLHTGRLINRVNLLPGKGGRRGREGAESYNCKKAWSSIIH
jgi:hypothetical protein